MKLTLIAALLALVTPTLAIDLPVEVLSGIGPTETTVTVNVPIGKAAAVTQVWMVPHNLSHGRKGSFRINNGEWTLLDNTTVQMPNKVRRMGGIGGPLPVFDIFVPVRPGELRDGQNKLTFRFSGPNGFSSGWSVVDFNLMVGTEKILPQNNFHLVYPETRPSFSKDPNDPTKPNPVNVAEGKRLWNEAILLRSPLVPTPLKTKCSNCHAPNGEDLVYFRNGRLRIKTRSEFHGLSAQNGRDIADFVWSGSTKPTGWFYDPPYQPGPGMDGKPVSSWAAGAGVRAVLANDSDMVAYLFPSGLSGAFTDNLRQLPISLPLPTWNQWLPRIHPRDAWGEVWDTAPINTYWFQTILPTMAAQADPAAYVKSGKFRTLLSNWYSRRQEFLKPRAEDWPAEEWTPEHSDKIYSTALWQLVQLWSLMQKYGLEGLGPIGNERTWYGNLLFAASPYMLKIPSSQRGLNGSALHNEYAASIWYWSQLVMNADNQGVPAGQSPVDWAYTYGKHKDLFVVTRYAEPLRMSAMVGKAIKIWDNPKGLDKHAGWNPDNKADVTRLVHFNSLPMWEQVPVEIKKGVNTNLINTWLAVCQKYTPEQYWAVGYADPAVRPVPNYSGDLGAKLAYSLPEWRNMGVDITALETWCATVWPLGVWKTSGSETDN